MHLKKNVKSDAVKVVGNKCALSPVEKLMG